MPNWCFNSMTVYGSPVEIKDFYKKLQNAWKKGDKLKHWHLYQIYEEFGYEKEEILGSDSNGYNRGYFDDIGEIVKISNEEWCFQLSYESAWGPMYEGFDWILKKHYKTLQQVTLAEETSNGVFVNTDVKGRFYPERYLVSIEDYDMFYCETEEEVIKIINDFIVDDEDRCETIEDCYNLLERNYGYLNYGNSSRYTTINEYSPD